MNQWTERLADRHLLRRIAVSGAGFLMLAGLVAFVIFEVTKTEIGVEKNGEEVIAYTHASTVEEALEEQHIDIGEHDQIDPAPDTVIQNSMTITYTPANQIFVERGDEQEAVHSTADNVEGLLEELGIDAGEHDVVEPSKNAELEDGMNVAYEEAFPVTLASDGDEKEAWTTKTSVEDFLEKKEVELGEDDRVEPSKDEMLNEETEVSIVRVETVTDVVTEAKDYGTVTEKDSSLSEGTEKVEESGDEGKVEKHYKVVKENGEEVSRELIEEKTVEESNDRVVMVGTGSISEDVSRGSSPSSSSNSDSYSNQSSSGGEWRTFEATAYTANCNGCSGTTRTGLDLEANPNADVIAVDPSVIPLGSTVEVKGRGTFTAADTGGAINGRKIDIFIPDQGAAQSFGRQSVEVRVLD